MSISSARTPALAICVAVAVGLASGCGSRKDASGPPTVCEQRAEAAAKAAVIKLAFDAGDLGTAKQLAARFSHVPSTAYLNPDGTLRPFSELSGDARVDFELWMNATVQNMNNRVGERVRAASDHTRQSSISSGRPCKQVFESS